MTDRGSLSEERLPLDFIGPIFLFNFHIRTRCFVSGEDADFLQNYGMVVNQMTCSVADLRGGAGDARPPPLAAKISSFSCSFRQKLTKS